MNRKTLEKFSVLTQAIHKKTDREKWDLSVYLTAWCSIKFPE